MADAHSKTPKMKKPLSNRQYITRNGLACPVCHSMNTAYDGEFTQQEEPVKAERAVRCVNPKCKATWSEVFELVRIIGLRDSAGTFIERT